MPMYTKSELLEHFDKVDCVNVDFSQLSDKPNRKGSVTLFYFIDSQLSFRVRYRNDSFRSYAVFYVCDFRRLLDRGNVCSFYRSHGMSSYFDFFRRLLSMK